MSGTGRIEAADLAAVRESGEVVVIDWGLARIRERPDLSVEAL